MQCPSISPESKSPCVLDDNPDVHAAGHQSEYDEWRTRACWATRHEDWNRWESYESMIQDLLDDTRLN
jgi:DNA polymerase II small subunit/DNA polymerase delta subunit B